MAPSLKYTLTRNRALCRTVTFNRPVFRSRRHLSSASAKSMACLFPYIMPADMLFVITPSIPALGLRASMRQSLLLSYSPGLFSRQAVLGLSHYLFLFLQK